MSPTAYRYISSIAFAAAAACIALMPTVGRTVAFAVAGLGLAVIVVIPLVNREIRTRCAGPGLHAGDGLLIPFAVAIAAYFISRSDPSPWNVGLGALTLVVAYFTGLSFWRQAIERADKARQAEAGEGDGGA